MKALSVKPHWASLIASGQKTIETRKRRTEYRGPLLICATQPDGNARCIVELIDCRRMISADWKAACCDPYPNAWGWLLGRITLIEPFPVRGQLGIFDVDYPLADQILPPPPLWQPR